MDASASLGLVYLNFVRKRIQDPMSQNFRKELMFIGIAVGVSVVASLQSHITKCKYLGTHEDRVS